MRDLSGKEAGVWGPVGDLLRAIGGGLPEGCFVLVGKSDAKEGVDKGPEGPRQEARTTDAHGPERTARTGERPVATGEVTLGEEELRLLLPMGAMAMRLYLIVSAADGAMTRNRLRQHYIRTTGCGLGRAHLNEALSELEGMGLVSLRANRREASHPLALSVDKSGNGAARRNNA